MTFKNISIAISLNPAASLTHQGYRLPAEWEPQEATLLAWPHNPDTWPGRLEPARAQYLRLIAEISDHQDIWLLVNGSAAEIDVRRRLTLHRIPQGRVRFFHLPTDDAWTRDFGPLSVVREVNGRRSRLFTDWIFDGWGGKYYGHGYPHDDEIPLRLASATGDACVAIDLILEGGSIEVNGRGLLLTSRSCLLNPNRNAHLSRGGIEKALFDTLAVKKILWVDEGVAGDDTDGHIDDIARFVSEDTIVCASEDDPNDENHVVLKRAYDFLKTATDQNGRPSRVVKLPMPEPIHFQRQRLPASYANFLITNDKVLVPVYRCRRDAEALAILRELFPRRSIVGIDCVEIVWGLGAIHCLTQNIPAISYKE